MTTWVGRDWTRNTFFRSTENRAGPSNLGNVISQILLCKQITPDFNEEELSSIVKDTHDVTKIISDLQEYMPQQELHLDKGRRVAWFTVWILAPFYKTYFSSSERMAALTGELAVGPWAPHLQQRNLLHKKVGLLCCMSRPNYL